MAPRPKKSHSHTDSESKTGSNQVSLKINMGSERSEWQHRQLFSECF